MYSMLGYAIQGQLAALMSRSAVTALSFGLITQWYVTASIYSDTLYITQGSYFLSYYSVYITTPLPCIYLVYYWFQGTLLSSVSHSLLSLMPSSKQGLIGLSPDIQSDPEKDPFPLSSIIYIMFLLAAYTFTLYNTLTNRVPIFTNIPILVPSPNQAQTQTSKV